MSILYALALAAAPAAQPAPAAAVDHSQHAQHQQGQKTDGQGCCCKKMADGKKMDCCAKHGESHGGGERAAHSGH